MKANTAKIIIVLIALLSSLSACSTTQDCTGNCTAKTIPNSVQPDKKTAMELKSDVAKPLAMATKGSLVITNSEGRVPADDEHTQANYQDIFCHKFAQIEWQFITTIYPMALL